MSYAPENRGSWENIGMASIKAGCLEIHYDEIGPDGGDPVIRRHGFPYDARAYDAVSASLARRGYRCLIPYLRGYGPTRFLSTETIRSGQQAALGFDLLAFMDALSIRTAFLGGYRLGRQSRLHRGGTLARTGSRPRKLRTGLQHSGHRECLEARPSD